MSSSQLLIASVRSEIYNSSLKKTNKVSIIIIIIAIINIIINFIFLGNDKYWMDGWWSVETDALRVAEKKYFTSSLIESKWSINGETSFCPTPTRLNSFSSDLA